MRLTLLFVLLLIALLPAPHAGAASRVALVVGNADYNEAAAVLRNPVNDATAVAAALRRLGFEVIEGTDLDEDGFYDRIGAFEDAARKAAVSLFFYAGHGLQVDGRNYMAPVDLNVQRKQDLRRGAVELADVLEVMRSETNLVILDACRNNPLAGELARSLGLSRAAVASRGLARVESASGTLIAYATEPGAVAADGTGKHSPYTEALLEHLETPGLSVQDLFTQVTSSVLASTDEKQKPWTHSSLSRIVRLAPGEDSGAAAAAPGVPAPASGRTSERLTAEQLAAERLFWESVKDSDDPADIQAYLDRYPDGTYAALARNRLKRLKGSAAPEDPAQDAPAAPSPAAPGPQSVEAGLGLKRPDRRLIQLGLTAEGFDPGPADGLFGRGTRGAIGRWQASRGDDATGYLDVEAAKLLLASGRQHEAAEAARQAAAQAERLKREEEARQRAQREARERARRQAAEEAAEAERRRESETLATLQEAIRLYVPINGRGDYTRARRLFEQAAQSGHPLAVTWLARCHVDGRAGFPENKERAQRLAQGAIHDIRRLAGDGDREAVFLLASAYHEGLAVAKDETLAVSWYRKAADQGHAIAQDNLGMMYFIGKGVAQNYSEALRWFRKAAGQGSAIAQYRLGEMYGNGYGVAQDSSEAVRWFRKAADQDFAFGQLGLGMAYEYGRGVAQDYNEAVRWYRKAANQGERYGQYQLAEMYLMGFGVTHNVHEAVRWYRQAAERGVAEAQTTLTNLGY